VIATRSNWCGENFLKGEKMNKAIWYIRSNIWPYRIIRDVILVQLFCGLGGFLVGWASTAAEGDAQSQVTLATLVMAPIGLSIVGAINPTNRWLHLAIVTLMCVIFDTGFHKLFFPETTIDFSVYTVFWYFVFFVVGGLLSMLYPIFKNKDKPKDEQRQ
jgi:hypothetical protein